MPKLTGVTDARTRCYSANILQIQSSDRISSVCRLQNVRSKASLREHHQWQSKKIANSRSVRTWFFLQGFRRLRWNRRKRVCARLSKFTEFHMWIVVQLGQSILQHSDLHIFCANAVNYPKDAAAAPPASRSLEFNPQDRQCVLAVAAVRKSKERHSVLSSATSPENYSTVCKPDQVMRVPDGGQILAQR
jgi:hypothetical protein